MAIEIKRRLEPRVDRCLDHASTDLKPERPFVIQFGMERFDLDDDIEAINLVDPAGEITNKDT